ncbi:MAG: indolepyruvate ferredoxin oxidoreductase family protein [Cohaesibacteraceae bacterium]|nr:indolepyruvate ferredoxin oxidoreductase family protein [Cohaesibacteraceae bacterium]MBL4876216.1 indolepyruvate ferredoxin oxidoreductase family protein [Cohaesibacteraceae bacterium]
MNAPVKLPGLSDKYSLENGSVYMTGIQALVRMPLDRIRLDRIQGLKTGGFISGYRGSPLGGYDQQLTHAKSLLDAHHIHFIPGVNEELGATSVWGTQKTGLHGQGSDFDGVFGIWYGKGPGVDRTGDVFKHANWSGTAKYGGALAVAGDDLLAKSSTMPNHSEYAFVDAEIPILNPADIQEVLDYGLHGLEMSRYSGLWTALIALADTMDASSIVNITMDRMVFERPRDIQDPRLTKELNRPFLLGNRFENEHLLREIRLPAAKAYVRANGLDGVRYGADCPRYGMIATGKAYRDLRQALSLLGIDDQRAKSLQTGIYKVAMPWPLEPVGIGSFAKSTERLMIVEHKRPLIETQIKDLFYHWQHGERPSVWGKTTPGGSPFLPVLGELGPNELVPALMRFIPGIAESEEYKAVAERLKAQLDWAKRNAVSARRTPYFCSGCPHSRSTIVPEGSRSMPGIGCHAMTEVAGRTSDGLVAMGGEGVHWVGQHKFSKDKHTFVNLGDGTYYHSGILAIRQSVAANVPITYKILFNDAVAMTGGQPHDGPLSVPMIVRQLEAEGVKHIVVLTEDASRYANGEIPKSVPVENRDKLLTVQKQLARVNGVTALVYDQTCAAEKRRRRKRGLMKDPDTRLFINDAVCEGCGDCSVQSNCMSVEPLKTNMGTKRTINQSSCNKDYSCVSGFCPSFVWIEGAALKKQGLKSLDLASIKDGLSMPELPDLDTTYNLHITGVGGSGITTMAAILAMAAHLDGVTASTLDMTGLAQKGGPVTSHVRFAQRGASIEGPRIPVAHLDALICGDLLVSGGSETLSLLRNNHTRAVANAYVTPTAEFVLSQKQSFNPAEFLKILSEVTQSLVTEDVSHIAEKLLGDAIFGNLMLVGMAFQTGLIPISLSSLELAVSMNGVAVNRNILSLNIGRCLIANRDRIAAMLPVTRPEIEVMKPQERVQYLHGKLVDYQNEQYGDRYRSLVRKIGLLDKEHGDGSRQLTTIVTEQLYRVMAYKDEYEVARLYASNEFGEKLNSQFEKPGKISIFLAPPLISRIDPETGRPKKRKFGPWIFKAFGILARMKGIRGTRFDLFGYTQERRAERALRDQYVNDLGYIAEQLPQGSYVRLLELANVPGMIKGFGPVKEANMQKADIRRSELLSQSNNKIPMVEAAE